MPTQTTYPAEDMRHLESRIRQQLHGRVAGLRLGISESGVTLSGRTTSYYAKQLAQHALLNATRLPLLANEIEVDRDWFQNCDAALDDS